MRIDVKKGEVVARAKGHSGPEVDIGAREDLAPVLPDLDRLLAIRIDAGSFGDGSVFSQARLLRRLGFSGRLCVKGPLIPDQLHMARGAGIDEIEPDEEILSRHGGAAWRIAAGRYRVSYVARLKESTWQTDQAHHNA